MGFWHPPCPGFGGLGGVGGGFGLRGSGSGFASRLSSRVLSRIGDLESMGSAKGMEKVVLMHNATIARKEVVGNCIIEFVLKVII